MEEYLYIGETGINKTKLRDRVRVYGQHLCQLQYQQLKVHVEGHLHTCAGGNFKIICFPSFKCILKANL